MMKKIRATPCIRTEKDALETVKKNNLISHLFGFADTSTVDMRYLENKIITFEIEYVPSMIRKLFARKPPGKQLVKVFFEGTRGVASYMDIEPESEVVQTKSELIQNVEFDEETMIDRSKQFLRKFLRRRTGLNVLLEVKEIETIYRPYYFVVQGELKEGNKIRYFPVVADKYKVSRTF